jgi:hypothetical protein
MHGPFHEGVQPRCPAYRNLPIAELSQAYATDENPGPGGGGGGGGGAEGRISVDCVASLLVFYIVLHNMKNPKANVGRAMGDDLRSRSVSLFVSWNDISSTDKHVPSHPRSPY